MRSTLFVPGDDEKKLAKALSSRADALIVDLEDSVAFTAKERARRIAGEFLRAAASQTPRPRLFVRVNPLESGLTDADLDAVMPSAPGGHFPAEKPRRSERAANRREARSARGVART